MRTKQLSYNKTSRRRRRQVVKQCKFKSNLNEKMCNHWNFALKNSPMFLIDSHEKLFHEMNNNTYLSDYIFWSVEQFKNVIWKAIVRTQQLSYNWKKSWNLVSHNLIKKLLSILNCIMIFFYIFSFSKRKHSNRSITMPCFIFENFSIVIVWKFYNFTIKKCLSLWFM